MSTQFITLAEARKRLGDNVVVVLEPDESFQAKMAGGTHQMLWRFDPSTGRIDRGDQRYFAMGVERHPGGSWQTGMLIEEPGQPGLEYVGHIIVDVNENGLVRFGNEEGFNGPVLKLGSSSVSKGDLDDSGREPDAVLELNAQRLLGLVAVYLNKVSFPDKEGMTPRGFVAASRDSRAISALAVLDLLSP